MCGAKLNWEGGEELQHSGDRKPTNRIGRPAYPERGTHLKSDQIFDLTQQVPLGQPISLECPLIQNSGTINVEMNWTRDGIPISSQVGLLSQNFEISKVIFQIREVQLLDNGHRLTLLSAAREDAVRFRCLAKNLAGDSSREFQMTVDHIILIFSTFKHLFLQILVPPRLNPPSSHLFQPIENQSVIIPCEIAEGIPLPSVEWTKDGKPIGESDLNGRIQMLSEGQQLKLTNAGKKDESDRQNGWVRESGKELCVVKM